MIEPTPILLFLDKDPEVSARYLTNYFLDRSIKYACQVLLCSTYYLLGFRNKTVFKYYFNKDRWDDTKFKYFPKYPLKTIPKFAFYNSEESRWCRKCSDHYRYVCKYLGYMLSEYEFRMNKEHKLVEMYPFLLKHQMELALSRGVRLVKLKDKSKFQLPWKNLPRKYRKKDIIKGYRLYYSSLVFSPVEAFIGTKREVPDFLWSKVESIV